MLHAESIIDMRDIPRSFRLTPKQQTQIRVTKTGEPLIKPDLIRHEVEKLLGPLSFLDYETFNPTVPLYDGYKPYQNMVFQYSLDVVEKDNTMHHYEHLVDHAG